MIEYCEEYDSYYCDETDVWTEDECGEVQCEYCSLRPERPSQVNR